MNSQAQAKIDANKVAIEELCKECGVQRMLVFGSALKETWNAKTSDIDFGVEFEAGNQKAFKMHAKLMSLFKREVHLIDLGAVRNPYFKQVILTEGEQIF